MVCRQGFGTDSCEEVVEKTLREEVVALEMMLGEEAQLMSGLAGRLQQAGPSSFGSCPCATMVGGKRLWSCLWEDLKERSLRSSKNSVLEARAWQDGWQPASDVGCWMCVGRLTDCAAVKQCAKGRISVH